MAGQILTLSSLYIDGPWASFYRLLAGEEEKDIRHVARAMITELPRSQIIPAGAAAAACTWGTGRRRRRPDSRSSRLKGNAFSSVEGIE